MILEKFPEIINVAKLRAILLLKANFNAIHKIIFNTRILLSLEFNKLISNKIIGSRYGQSVIQVVINKKVISDIAN